MCPANFDKHANEESTKFFGAIYHLNSTITSRNHDCASQHLTHTSESKWRKDMISNWELGHTLWGVQVVHLLCSPICKMHYHVFTIFDAIESAQSILESQWHNIPCSRPSPHLTVLSIVLWCDNIFLGCTCLWALSMSTSFAIATMNTRWWCQWWYDINTSRIFMSQGSLTNDNNATGAMDKAVVLPSCYSDFRALASYSALLPASPVV